MTNPADEAERLFARSRAAEVSLFYVKALVDFGALGEDQG
jgi:hypothetical protein